MLAAGGEPLTVVDDNDKVVGLATLELLGGVLGNGGGSPGRGARWEHA